MHIQTSSQEKLSLGFGGATCNWGTHICGLYETEAERDEIILGFLHAGAEQKDLQLYCPAEQTEEEFKQKFSEQCHCCAETTNSPEIFQFYSAKELYYPTGVFSPWDMDDALDAFYKNSQKDGKKNVRATAEMVWALDGTIQGIDHLMAYESRLNYFVKDKPWISVCMYNVTRFSGDVIMNVLRTHPYTISRNVITENPFYMDPDDFLAQHAPEFLGRNRPANAEN